MPEYAKKTCNICGLRDIQPNMVRKQKEVVVGSGRDKLGWGTIFQTMTGTNSSANKAATRRMQKVLWANNNREYKRKTTVWMCPDCAGVKKEKTTTRQWWQLSPEEEAEILAKKAERERLGISWFEQERRKTIWYWGESDSKFKRFFYKYIWLPLFCIFVTLFLIWGIIEAWVPVTQEIQMLIDKL